MLAVNRGQDCLLSRVTAATSDAKVENDFIPDKIALPTPLRLCSTMSACSLLIAFASVARL